MLSYQKKYFFGKIGFTALSLAAETTTPTPKKHLGKIKKSRQNRTSVTTPCEGISLLQQSIKFMKYGQTVANYITSTQNVQKIITTFDILNKFCGIKFYFYLSLLFWIVQKVLFITLVVPDNKLEPS